MNVDVSDHPPLQRLTIPNDFGLESTSLTDSSLESIHLFLVHHWILSLADKVPGSVRLSKDRVARHVALATFLAGITARGRGLERHADNFGELKQPPLALGAFASHEPPYSSPHLASYPINALDRADDESMQIQGNLSTTVFASSEPVDRILSRLGSTGDKSSSVLAGRGEGIADSATDPERKVKQRRLVARRLQLESQRERKRQRLESKERGTFASDRVFESASQPAADGLAPSAWESSQPMYATHSQSLQMQTRQSVVSDYDGKQSVEVQQKQDLGLNGMAASQVLPGAFGGRQGLAVRRKDRGKRKAGF